MNDSLFDQLDFARQVTLRTVKEVTEAEADVIPEGFNNNIRWNLGHIYSALEQFAFYFAQEPMNIPESYKELFGMGSKPSEWKVQPPALSELLELLEEQPKRIREKLSGRLDEPVAQPLQIPGLTLKTIGELLTFTLYHEAGHTETIKHLKKFI